MNNPVLFLTFNRPYETKLVFNEIRKAKPPQLFIASDGWRNEKEKIIVESIRKNLLKSIDWKCKVKTLFRDKNLGCKYAVSGAINWFFENVEQGIILEDDCLPSQSFFRFCDELLDKYKMYEFITHIAGSNFDYENKINESYFFSDVINNWGWATWKRAWKDFDVNMKKWESVKFNLNKYLYLVRNENLLWKINQWRIYNLTYKQKLNTWDYQWCFINKLNKRISINPKVNLIKNIGFNQNATNTLIEKRQIENKELDFPLNHPYQLVLNKEYNYYFNKYLQEGFLKRKLNKLIKL